MKTSHKILLITGGIITALFITGLMILRSDLSSYVVDDALFKEISTEPFHKIKGSDGWDIKVTQGRKFSVKLADNQASELLKPVLKTVDSTLMLEFDTSELTSITERISAQIIVPFLQSVSVGDSCRLHLNRLNLESLEISLGFGSSLISEENTFEHVSYKSKGASSLEWIDDPLE